MADPKASEPGRLAPSIAPRGDRHHRWPFKRLTAIAVVGFALSAWLAAASIGYLKHRDLALRAIEQTGRIEAAYEELRAQSKRAADALQGQIGALEQVNAGQASAIGALTEIKQEMAERLAASERRMQRLADQRDRARRLAHDLKQTIATTDLRLESAVYEGGSLANQLATAEARLIEVSDQRDAIQRSEANLRWRLANFQTQLERMGGRQELARSWLEGWVLGNVETLEELVAGTGVDLELLVARAAGSEVGQGGPLEAMVEPLPDEMALADPVSDDIQRLTALQKLASTLPLASPLDQFELSSPFGKRQDPFTKGWAFHSGLDLRAAAGSKVLATAPGTVVVAGRSGPYGNMVEIDHGMGVITRYGHLKSIAVNVGDQIAFREPIGVIGNTGRSTSQHLHYEVRVDGAPHDPSRFLDAGRYMIGIFDGGQPGIGMHGKKS